ncbi:hypothetical protein [uncultured Actinomyces sp.]|uniref:hypothetical protein n=1 Tax=uncultured Actinomyces sp. TaxID=249061 RepID=UPI00288B2AF4|nr:hypothetical protein [uncultured Actinomyces sp.]
MALFRSKQAVCPYCYRRIESDKAAFRCNGHAAAGKSRCVARPDPERKQVLGVDEAVLPTWPDKRSLLQRHRPFICPDCLGPTTRVCPVCHTPWPSTFTADSPLIGLVGVRGSGKTIMLSVLAQELTTSIQRRFDAAIHPTGNRRLVSQLANWRSDMGRGGHLPSQTETYQHVSKDQRDSAEPAVFEWQLADGRNRQRSTIFSFYDTAGEDLASMDRTRELNYLAATDGVILLLDPFGFTGNHDLARSKGVDEDLLHDRPEDVLRNIVELLRQADQVGSKKKISRPLAVVVSKIDAFFDSIDEDSPLRRPSSDQPYFDEAESLEVHEHVAMLLDEWSGGGLLRMLELNFSTFRLFAASALGAEPDYARRTANPRGVLPHRVAEPLLWLMARRGFLPKEG